MVCFNPNPNCSTKFAEANFDIPNCARIRKPSASTTRRPSSPGIPRGVTPMPPDRSNCDTPHSSKEGRDWKAAAYHTTILTPGAGQPLQVRLGYPDDAKVLILNADDLAVTHSEDVASFAALDQKLVTSATVMVPCPWFTEVADYAKAHPEADLGLHLTLTAEWQTYRWGPIASRALVPSLVGPDGYFYPNSAEVVKHAKLDEVEIEIRAQIERAKSMGLQPSHLDAHMHALYASAELFNVFLKVAREYKLPIRMARNDPFFKARVRADGSR